MDDSSFKKKGGRDGVGACWRHSGVCMYIDDVCMFTRAGRNVWCNEYCVGTKGVFVVTLFKNCCVVATLDTVGACVHAATRMCGEDGLCAIGRGSKGI